MALWVKHPSCSHEDAGSILASVSGLRIWRCHKLWRSSQIVLVSLWLWHQPAAAGPTQPLAWELPYAKGEALKNKKKTLSKDGDLQVSLSVFCPAGEEKSDVLGLRDFFLDLLFMHVLTLLVLVNIYG